MANKKITALTSVSTLPDEAIITGVDTTRSEGDQNVKMTVENAKTLFGGSGSQNLQQVTDGLGNNITTNSIEIQNELTVGDGSVGILRLNDGKNGTIEATGTQIDLYHDDYLYTVSKNGISAEILSSYGDYNANTNTPALSNIDTGKKGVELKVTVAGTQDFGAGNITFGVDDIIANDGLIWYKKVDNNQSGSQNFQQVTDNGSVTDNDVEIQGELTVGIGSESNLIFAVDNIDSSISCDENSLYIEHNKKVVVSRGGKGGNLVAISDQVYNATTNTPTVSNNDVDNDGYQYRVSVAGTQDFGAGDITFGVDDIIANDGSIWYKKVDNNQSGGSTPNQNITFTSSIPFTAPITTMEKVMDANLLLTPNTTGAENGYGTTLKLTSDGLSTLTFDNAFRKLSTSDDFVLEDGAIYLLTFYFDNSLYYYTISKVSDSTANPTDAPTRQSDTVEEDDKNRAIFTYNRPLDSSNVPDISDFSFVGKTVSAVSISGSQVFVDVTEDWSLGETITSSYVSGVTPLQDIFGNDADDFTSINVVNNITTAVTGYVEWVDALDSNMQLYDNGLRRVRATGTATATNIKTFRATNQLVDGTFVQFKTPSVISSTRQHGIILNSSIISSVSGDFGIYIASGNVYQRQYPLIEAQETDTWYRILYNGSNMEYYKSSDNLNFTLIATSSTTPTGSYYIYAYISELNDMLEITSNVSAGASVVNPTNKLYFYTNPELLTTTLAQYVRQNTDATGDVASDGGVEKIRLISGLNQASIRYNNKTSNKVYPVDSLITVEVNGVTINSGKLFFKLASAGQSSGSVHELSVGSNSFNIDTSTITDEYIWLTSDSVANGGGDGFIGEIKIISQ